ncbi:MAG: aquaporin Z [Acidimicrobiia bacterium]
MSGKGKVFSAELVGTAVLVMGGPGAAVLAGKDIGFMGVAFAFGLALLVLVYAIGPISGCHVNPAVTLGRWLAKETKTEDLPVYWIAQLVGAALGGLVIFVIATGQSGFDAKAGGFASNGYGKHSPQGFDLRSAIVVEILFTALLVFTVLSTSHGKFPHGFAGLAIGGALLLIHLVTIPVDNTSVNPARSFGTAIFQHGWALGQLWAFVVFPMIGGAVGWLAWRLVSDEPLSAA